MRMPFSFLLHFYQPFYQQDDILERIVNESYRPLMDVFLDNPGAKATFNFSGCLLELLADKGYGDVLESLKTLLERNQIELTGTAAYHAFLPLLDDAEFERQIKLNEKISRKHFGDLFQPVGFFPPEMAYDLRTARKVHQLGYRWMMLAEVAFGPRPPWPGKVYCPKQIPEFQVYFRNKRVSGLILSAIVRSALSLYWEIQDIWVSDSYLLSVMDAETFGHHRPGQDDALRDIIGSSEIETLMVSEIENRFSERQEVEPRACTWSNDEQDFWLDKERKVASENPFLLWNDPNNPIHQLQWEFANWVTELVRKNSSGDKKVREMLDKALGSDQFWWASAKPWWSLEMIEAGAYRFKEIVESIKGVSKEDVERASGYYHNILEFAFEWQRSGKIRQVHKEAQGWQKTPFKDRTPPDWYNLIILEFEDEMNKAVEKREFEKAIKWRDAVIKLKKGHDIYDVLHVVNELHAARRIPSLKPVAEHLPEEISEFARSNFIELDG